MAKITFESICKDIVLAQACSDAGKGIKFIPDRTSSLCFKKAWTFDYSDKSHYILRAICQINNSKFLGVRYHVSDDKEFRGCIVYFQVSIPGHKHSSQVSFHVPEWDKNVKRVKGFVGKTPLLRWDKKSSRNTCISIIKYFKW